MSLLKTVSKHELQAGAYKARVANYHEVEEVLNSHTGDVVRQAYVAVNLELDNTNFTDRLYLARIPFVMKCLKLQFGKQFEDIDLESLLKYAESHPFNVLVTVDTQYGIQVNYAVED